MWKHRILYIAAVAAAAVAYIVADRREALALLCFLIVLPIFSLVLQILAMRSVRFSCELQANTIVGQNVPVRFRIVRTTAFPMGVILLDVTFENSMFGEKQTLELHLQTTQKKQLLFCYTYHAKDCGRVRVRATRVCCYDLLGLFVMKRRVYVDEELVVYPQELSLGVELMNRPETKSFGEFYAPNRIGQDVSEVADLRDYVEGDSPKSIHWKMSGKLGRLIVREFGLPADYNTLILYNYSKNESSRKREHREVNSRYGNESSRKREHREVNSRYGDEAYHARCNAVLTLAVSLSRGLLKHNLEHLVGTANGGGMTLLPVQTLDSYDRMVGGVLGISVRRADGEPDTLYTFLHGNMQYSFTKVIYITMDYDEQAVRHLAQQTHLLLVHVVSGKSKGYASRDGYSLISVNADDYQDTFRQILI